MTTSSAGTQNPGPASIVASASEGTGHAPAARLSVQDFVARGEAMLIRRAATDRVGALPRSLAAAHVSLATFRHVLTISLVSLIVAPMALLAMFADTPLQFLPLIVSVGGILWLRLRSLSLEKDLRRARVRALDASDLERQRIQRDIHDGAQQRLVSVRIHLGLLAQDALSAGERSAIEDLGHDLDAALSDIRNVTRQESPQLLRQNGVVDSLRSVAAHAPVKVTVETRDFGRYAPRSSGAFTTAAWRRCRTPSSTAGRRRSSDPARRRPPPDRLLGRRFRRGLRPRPRPARCRPREPGRSRRRHGRPPHHRLPARHGDPHPRRDPDRRRPGPLKEPVERTPLSRAP